MCVEIASGYTIDRSIPFTIESTLTSNTTAEGNSNIFSSIIIQLRFFVFPFIDDDFIAVSEQQVFVSQNQAEPICITVNLVNDTRVETNESFSVQILAAPPVSTLSTQLIAMVIIQNDDSKLLMLALTQIFSILASFLS